MQKTSIRYICILLSILVSSIVAIAPPFSVGAMAFYGTFDSLRSSARSYFDFSHSKSTLFVHTTYNDSVSNNPIEYFHIESIASTENGVFHFFLFGLPSGNNVLIYECSICFKSATINTSGTAMNVSNSSAIAYTCQPNNGYYPYLYRYGTVNSSGVPTFTYRGQSTSNPVTIISGALYNYDIRLVLSVPASKFSSFEYTTYTSNDNTDSSIINPSLSWQDYVDSDSALSSYFDEHFSNATDLEDNASSEQEFDAEEESTTDISTSNSKDNPNSPDFTGTWTQPNGSTINNFEDEYNGDLESRINDLISGVDNVSNIMSSNLDEMSSNFQDINTNISNLFSVFPPVIISIFICSVVVLIAIKLTGR